MRCLRAAGPWQGRLQAAAAATAAAALATAPRSAFWRDRGRRSHGRLVGPVEALSSREPVTSARPLALVGPPRWSPPYRPGLAPKQVTAPRLNAAVRRRERRAAEGAGEAHGGPEPTPGHEPAAARLPVRQ